MRVEVLDEVDMNYQFFVLPCIKIDWFSGWRIKVSFLAWSITWVITEPTVA